MSLNINKLSQIPLNRNSETTMSMYTTGNLKLITDGLHHFFFQILLYWQCLWDAPVEYYTCLLYTAAHTSHQTITSRGLSNNQYMTKLYAYYSYFLQLSNVAELIRELLNFILSQYFDPRMICWEWVTVRSSPNCEIDSKSIC